MTGIKPVILMENKEFFLVYHCCPVKSQATPIGYHLVQYRICRLIGKMPSESRFF